MSKFRIVSFLSLRRHISGLFAVSEWPPVILYRLLLLRLVDNHVDYLHGYLKGICESLLSVVGAQNSH